MHTRIRNKYFNKYFRVVINSHGHYSIWPTELKVPSGWEPTGFASAKLQCLEQIAEAWRDMRPRLEGAGPLGVHGGGQPTADEVPDGPRTLVELFDHSVQRYAEAPAARDGEKQLNYAELSRCSAVLAGQLVELGIEPEDRIALYMERRVDTIAAVLGVVNAGAAYVPIDTAQSDIQRDRMITHGDVRLVITEPGWAHRLSHLECPVLEWHGDDALSSQSSGVLPRPAPQDAACVLYTASGGQLDGIVLEHRQLIAFACNPVLPEVRQGDRTGQVANISQDQINFEIWSTLAGGGEIVVLTPIHELPAGEWGGELARNEISVLLAPATVINHIAKVDPQVLAPLRILHSSGSGLSPSSCEDVLSSEFSGRFFSLYGSVETTTACARYEILEAPEEIGSVPIGQALVGSYLYVLDQDFRPVDAGESGELFVAGAAISRGYLLRPALTAECFLPDPFTGDGGRMLPTGDRVRQRADGMLEYLGPVDLISVD